MAKNNNIGDLLQSVANAIRTRKGTTGPINAQNFDQEILDIPSGMNSIDETAEVIKACGGEVSYDDATLANGIAKMFADEPTENTFNGVRLTADGGAIRDGVAYVSKVKGKTVKVHQKRHRWIIESNLGLTTSFDTNGIGAISGTVNAQGALTAIGFYNRIAEHKFLYYIGADIDVYVPNGSDYSQGYRVVLYTAYTSNPNAWLGAIFSSPGATINSTVYPMIFDLTEMFGSGNEPATPDEFAQRLGYATIDDLPYIPYTETPQLMSLTASGVKSVGRNLWNLDKLTRIPNSILSINGSLISLENRSTYYMKIDRAVASRGVFFNCDNKGTEIRLAIFNDIPTIGAKYVDFYYDGTSNPLFVSGNGEFIAISIENPQNYQNVILGSYPKDYNGVYEPYQESLLPLPIDQIEDGQGNKVFPYGLLSADDIHDEIDFEKGVATKKIGTLDMGRIDWALQSINAYGIANFYFNPTTYGLKIRDFLNRRVLLADYSYQYSVIANTTTEGFFPANETSFYLRINSSKASSVEGLKSFLSGKILGGELATTIEYPLYTASSKCMTAGAVSDEVDVENGVFRKKVGVLDLGSLGYWLSNKGTYQAFGVTLPASFKPTQGAVSTPFSTLNAVSVSTGRAIGVWLGQQQRLYICDGKSTTVDEIKAAMQGVLLYYEIATPQTYPLLPTQHYYKVQQNGTEELVSEGMSAPLVAEIGYRGSVEAQALNLL